MTKAEAIEALEVELNKWEADCKSYHAVKEALPMAIEALENENALIDRILEIIDEVIGRDVEYAKDENDEALKKCIKRSIDTAFDIRDAVKALKLKGGEQE